MILIFHLKIAERCNMDTRNVFDVTRDCEKTDGGEMKRDTQKCGVACSSNNAADNVCRAFGKTNSDKKILRLGTKPDDPEVAKKYWLTHLADWNVDGSEADTPQKKAKNVQRLLDEADIIVTTTASIT